MSGGSQASDSPLNPLADLQAMTENRVNEALLDILPGPLINEIVEGKVREFIGQPLDEMVSEAIKKRFEEAMEQWLRDTDFDARIRKIGESLIEWMIPRDRIQEDVARRVAVYMSGKVDGIIESSVATQFRASIEKWLADNLGEDAFDINYAEVVGDIAREYARGMGQNLMNNVMQALRMVGGGVIATANAQVGVHEKMVECGSCHMLLGDSNGSGVECPNCKQFVYG